MRRSNRAFVHSPGLAKGKQLSKLWKWRAKGSHGPHNRKYTSGCLQETIVFHKNRTHTVHKRCEVLYALDNMSTTTPPLTNPPLPSPPHLKKISSQSQVCSVLKTWFLEKYYFQGLQRQSKHNYQKKKLAFLPQQMIRRHDRKQAVSNHYINGLDPYLPLFPPCMGGGVWTIFNYSSFPLQFPIYSLKIWSQLLKNPWEQGNMA